MQPLNEEYLTVAEAANLVRVSPSTIRRWIREGNLPAYRLGLRRVGLKRDDLATLVTPIRTEILAPIERPDDAPIPVPKLTPEQKRRALEALEQAQQLAKEILARRGGVPFSDTVEIIHEMREERDRQLLEAIRGSQP
jgi:excisionase family DNA binding protein